jgi:CBS domain-containing protein
MTTTPPLVLEATRAFLRRHTPFDRMSDAALEFAIPRMALAYFAKDTPILGPDAGPVTHLHVVQRGLVASHAADPSLDPDPTAGPGECFPVGALSAGGAAVKRYVAVQDTFCYLLPREDFLEWRRLSPEFERFCTQAITETLAQSLAQMQGEYSRLAAQEQTLAQPVSELVRRPAVTCAATLPLVDALAMMRGATVRTIVVIGSEGAPVGIFTLIDLLERVVLAERPLTTPIGKCMTTPLVTLPASATAADALQRLAERRIRQLVVVDGIRVLGVISERDLFALQRVSMRQVTDALQAARDRPSLQRAAADIRALTQNLLAQGAAAEPLTRTIAALNDALSRQVIEMVLGRHALPDSDWCWLALGSEGRGEQTFATDQDNALVFVPHDPPAVEQERGRLIAFARDVNAELDAIGFPLCKGDVMAGNPQMCLTVDEWQSRFLQWIREPTPDALLGANIVFDFRPLYGDTTLVDALREWLSGYTRDNQLFLRFMVDNALQTEPPLGIIRTFVTDDADAQKGTLDLKSRGTRIFVDAARTFALGFGLTETGTAARLRVAGARLKIEPRHVDATIEGFHFLQLLRLRKQYVPGAHADANRIDPYALNEVDQRMLKEAFRQARKLQQRLRQTYRL